MYLKNDGVVFIMFVVELEWVYGCYKLFDIRISISLYLCFYYLL